jgi:hypothetical protein
MGMGFNQIIKDTFTQTKPIPTLTLPLKGRGSKLNASCGIAFKIFHAKFHRSSYVQIPREHKNMPPT